ncbi:MAP7 domain-containing protein 2-like isoform X2 [Boleophthalmus pectinirostris]|uniref:MAP7 domain-containing protein 2-like isoform X2 n=1 Tax=Boleophthalmus pectinirostris TaxID=150288 RepID=UPI00242BD521|nr:MAP7 domain-containing protein 2-like isoform X2 [Boleophthalmus pectinirostris]
MTKVSPGHAEMTALAPPSAPLLVSTHRSPSRSPTKTDKLITDLPDVLRDKERRVKEQLERCAEQRGRKMEEQKKREERRRNAAEERRRLQQEAEKERLEAMVRRRGGRGGNNNHLQNGTTGQSGQNQGGGGGEGQLDNRPKRWTWGGPPDGVEVVDFLTPSDQPMNKQLSNSSAALHSPERVSSNNHRLHRSLSNRRSIAAFPEETKARTPTGDGPPRSSSFRGNSKGPATPKRVRSNRSRPQSPCSPGQYPPSPRRHKASTPGTPDTEVKGHISTLERKTKTEGEKKIPKSTSRELNAESPMTPTGRSVGGTTDAEEASRVLAERRRLARIQKEQEEKQRLEEERLRAEEEQRRRQERQEQQERQAREAEEERVRREQERREREDLERRQKEQRWKDMQQQLDKEREEAFLRAQKEAERKRQEREQLHIQEEQERQQRKKRIEEIMKRTRKSEVEAPSVVQESEVKVEAAPPSGQDVPLEPSQISLGPLEKSCVDELSDGVQSMDVSSPSVSISPVSREEQPSAQDYSPVTDADAMGWSDFSKLQPASSVGDLNKNLLLQACSADAPPMIPPVGPKLDVQ